MTTTAAIRADQRTERPPVVTVDHLRKIYGATVAVDDISFTIHAGEIFGIIGPNGAGKTTTVECIAGLRVPDGGTIRVLGLDPQHDRAGLHQFLGVQLQQSALPPKLRVGEVLDMFASFYDRPLDPTDLLESLGLEGMRHDYVGRLSGGVPRGWAHRGAQPSRMTGVRRRRVRSSPVTPSGAGRARRACRVPGPGTRRRRSGPPA